MQQIKNLYQVHPDSDNRTYWIGFVVRDENGSPLFVQQIGNDYHTKAGAERAAAKLNAA